MPALLPIGRKALPHPQFQLQWLCTIHHRAQLNVSQPNSMTDLSIAHNRRLRDRIGRRREGLQNVEWFVYQKAEAVRPFAAPLFKNSFSKTSDRDRRMGRMNISLQISIVSILNLQLL
jgi:hypothetical protein